MNEFQAWERILLEWKQVHRLKTLNQRLYDQLSGSIIHLVRYAQDNNINLPNQEKLWQLIDRVEDIMDDINEVKVSDETLQSDKDRKTDGDLTEPTN
jgi:hypothetical protein